MSNEWNDAVNKASEEAANKKRTEAAAKERYEEREVPSLNKRSTSWDYERKKFDEILGWKKVGDRSEGHTYKTGEKEIVKTSENSVVIKDKEAHYSIKYDRMILDKGKIKDMQKYKEIEREIDEFLSEAKMTIGEGVVPVYFRDKKEYIPYLLNAFGKMELIGGACALAFLGLMSHMFYVILVLFLAFAGWMAAIVYFHKKRNASKIMLINAYHKKMKEFETEIKQITRF